MSIPMRPGFPRGFLRRGTAIVLAACIALPLAGNASAQENKILTATKSALYGAAAGLLLGGVTALVVHDNDRDTVIRWGIVLGTFTGFAYGLYDVTRPSHEYSLLPAGGGKPDAVLEAWVAGSRHGPAPAAALCTTTRAPVLGRTIQPTATSAGGRIPW